MCTGVLWCVAFIHYFHIFSHSPQSYSRVWWFVFVVAIANQLRLSYPYKIWKDYYCQLWLVHGLCFVDERCFRTCLIFYVYFLRCRKLLVASNWKILRRRYCDIPLPRRNVILYDIYRSQREMGGGGNERGRGKRASFTIQLSIMHHQLSNFNCQVREGPSRSQVLNYFSTKTHR